MLPGFPARRTRFGLVVATLLLLPGCTQEPAGPLVAAVSDVVETREPVWVNRMDVDYFHYDTLESVRLEMPESQTDTPATASIPIPVGIAYVSVQVTIFLKDPTLVSTSGVHVRGEWEDGASAFRVEFNAWCSNTLVPGYYCEYIMDPFLVEPPSNGTTLKLSSEDGVLASTPPFSWNGRTR